MNLINKLQKFKSFKKAVIVACGPSTSFVDWDKINQASSEDTVFLSCNRISLIFNSTKWRPDIYTCFSTNCLNYPDWIASVDACLQEKKIESFVYSEFKQRSQLSFFHDNVNFCDSVIEHKNAKGLIPEDFLNTDLNKNITKSFSAVVPLFQICNLLKVEKITVVGQDGYFKNKKNHFNKKYGYEPSKSFEVINKRITDLHRELKRYFRKQNVEIFNSSENSILKNVYNFIELQSFVEE